MNIYQTITRFSAEIDRSLIIFALVLYLLGLKSECEKKKGRKDMPKKEETGRVSLAKGKAILAMRDRFLSLQEKYRDQLEQNGDVPLVAEVVLRDVMRTIEKEGLNSVLEQPQGVMFAELLGHIAKQSFLYGYLWAKGEEEQKAIGESGTPNR